MDSRIFEFIFKGSAEFGDVQAELEQLLAINLKLQNQSAENAKKSREEAAARKQLAEEAKQAALSQIQSELGVQKAMDAQKGIIEELRNRIKLLKQGREQANDVASINKYNAALQISQKELATLTGATDKFKGSNGFWREMSGYVAAAFAVSSITDWTGKIFDAQSKVEGFRLSLNRLVGEKEAALIESQLKNLIVDTPLQFEGAVKGVEKLIFAYQNADQSTKTVIADFKAFGNVAKGNEENLKGIIKALEDTGNQGKLTGQEILQFGNAGVNIIGLLADSTGKTRKEIKQMQSEGTLSFDLVREALIKAGSEGGKFAGAMSVAMGTVAGKVSNFKDAVFFAMSTTGEYFKENAKSAVTWATSLVQSLFGTESAVKRTIDVVKTVISTFVAYQVVTRASAAATGVSTAAEILKNAVTATGNVISTQASLLRNKLTGDTIALAAAETEATAATASFNSVVGMSPLGLLTILIGAAVAGYQMYQSSVEAAQEEQNKLTSKIAEAIVPLKSEQLEFNKLSKEVLNNKLSLEERNKAFDILKEKFPVQLKGIDDLKEAELKLSGVVRSTNNDFMIRAKLLENEVRINYNREKANIWLREQIELESKLATASTTRTAMVTGTAGNVNVYASEREEIAKAIEARKRYVNNALQANETIAKYGESLNSKLKFQYEQDANNKVNTEKEGNDKKKKERIDSAKTLALIQEKADNDALEKTRRTEQKSLELQRDIDIQKINDSKASETKKAAERLKVQEKYFVDSSKLTNKYDDQEAKDQEKKNREWLKANYEMHKDTIEQAQKKMAEQQKLNQKEYDEKKKLDEKAAKETQELNSKQYELIDKLRVLDKISHAKNSKELIRIENETKEDILQSTKERFEKEVLYAKLKLARMKATYGEDSVEYKSALADMIISQQGYNDASIKLVEFRTEKVKDSIQKEEELFRQMIGTVTQITDQLFDAIDKQTDERLSKTTSAIEKNMLNQIKAESKMAKDGLSAMVSLLSGDIPGAITKGLGLAFDAINNAVNRTSNATKARIQEQQEFLARYAEASKASIEGIVTKLSGLNDIYKPIEKSNQSLAEQSKLLDEYLSKLGQRGFTATSLLEKELAYGQAVVSNYNTSLSKENELYEKKVDNINKSFDLEVQKINQKYDLISQKAEQQYNAETLAIVAAGSAQLEALITNEASLSSVRADFAAKRLAVEQSFPLASKAITEDMSQAEIDAINASIKARDEQFAKIQSWYNDELIFIATSEGQKRKEYTDTEKIQNQIRDNLELAAIKFQADEIQRDKEKTDAIVLAEKQKNELLATEKATHDQILISLEQKKNDAIAESFKRLQAGIEAEVSRVSGLLSAINDKTSQEYKDLQAQLDALINKYRELVGEFPTITINTPTIPVDTRGPRGFKDGTNRLPNASGLNGVDTELIRADVGERIIPTKINNQLKAFFGKDINNSELVNMAMANFTSVPIMDYNMISSISSKNVTDKRLLVAINDLNKGMKNLKQVNVNVVNGLPSVEERSSNRMTKYV